MFHIRKIESFDLPELEPYRTMKWQQPHRDRGIFVAEGEKVVRRLLESSFGVVSVLMPEKWVESYQPLLEKRPEDVAVFVAEKSLLETLTGFSMYQGLLALGQIPPPLSLAGLVRQSLSPRLFLAVESLSNAENLGGLVRNCAAFGAHGLIVGETCCSPYLRRAVRSSMGTIFQMPIVESRNLAADLASLRSHGVSSFAAHPHTTAHVITQLDLRQDCCLVLGSEGAGLSQPVLEACLQAAAIPMQGGVDSLNVGAAGAIFLYEAMRQRGKC